MWYDLAIYSLKVGACLAVFYLFFKLLLSRETFHRFNRIVVLGAIVLSFVLPLCVITVYRTLPALPVSVLPAVSAVADLPAEGHAFPWERLLGGLFAVGVAGAFVRLCWSLGGVVRLIGRCDRRERLDDGTVLVHAGDSVRPFSWGRFIVLSDRDRAVCGEAILLHERAHVRMHHSADLLLTDLCGCLQWFNPAMWLLRRELRDIHEYEADEAVISSGIDAKSYQLLLIRKAVGGRWYSIANSFNHSKLKNRITMMLRKKSSRWTGARVLLLLPLTALALGAFAETVYLFPEDKGKKENLKIRTSAPDGADPLVLVDGREQPASSINDISPEQIQSITVLKDSTAIRMYGDKGRNGVVLVELKKEGDGTQQSDADDVVVVCYGQPSDAAVEAAKSAGLPFRVTGGNDPAERLHVLYLVDGERVPEIGSLDPGRIESVSVFKGKDNIPSEYAGQGYEGVIEIRTKKKSDGVRILSPEEARAYFESKEGKEVQRSLDRMKEYFKSDEWQEAQRKMEASGEYFNSDEWKEVQRKMDAYFKSDEWQEALRKMEASGEYFNSDEWKEAQLRLKELDKLSDRLGSEDGLGIVIRNASIGKGAFAGMKVYIDGREASSEEVDRLDPENIRHMEVLTGKKAVRRYGEQASEGVVEIKTRK
ncbi:TonB-dependent receptor plug domain-containing protein [uncultured Alistipes sp.]|uniref:TonB-dependent receptor plug domain-containing protein n=1 Tax=uncultured Alistipes sp. TaxID=538949 RepID=UPI002638B9E5|nr:TonB-dependent receptor plug domain-containing protein [uncultured Alistipes sp.]